MPAVNSRIGTYEVDFLWRSEKVVVELDGFTYHRDFKAFENDRQRNADLASMGYEVIRISYTMLVEMPEKVLGSIRTVLERKRLSISK